MQLDCRSLDKCEIYSILAEGLTSPTSQWIDWWNSSCIHDSLQEAFEDIGFSVGIPLLGNFPDVLVQNDLLSLHEELFRIPSPKRITPVEGVYRPGRSALHMKSLYESLEIDIPPEYAFAPDHLILELEFVSLLEEMDNKTLKHFFMEEHLDWVGELVKDAVGKGWSGFYLEWLKLIDEYVKWDRAQTY